MKGDIHREHGNEILFESLMDYINISSRGSFKKEFVDEIQI